jgi:antitoxin ParD1/3/4
MNITLPREQQEWLEAQVKAGVYESVDAAVATIIAEHREDLEWMLPLVEEGRASLEREGGLTLEEHRAKLDEHLAKLTR